MPCVQLLGSLYSCPKCIMTNTTLTSIQVMSHPSCGGHSQKNTGTRKNICIGRIILSYRCFFAFVLIGLCQRSPTHLCAPHTLFPSFCPHFFHILYPLPPVTPSSLNNPLPIAVYYPVSHQSHIHLTHNHMTQVSHSYAYSYQIHFQLYTVAFITKLGNGDYF